ncbi:MAG: hypothetical protein AB3N63_07780 [Puniceicoccaceae bacterium]
MTNHNFEGQSEGDWDDRGNLSWSEVDWQQFLKRQEKEVARFISFYDSCPVEQSERLDWVARQMGWDTEDWSVSDFPDEDEDSEPWKPGDEDSREMPDNDPYTLHRHPVYVVTTGLYLQMRYFWRSILQREEGRINPLLCWDFAETIAEAEKQTVMAMQSMDMADYLLCVIHMKRAMRGLNLAMSMVPQLMATTKSAESYRNAFLVRFFDLREVCLRVMMDCREEEKRNYRD